jgi:PAT family beta-lactamase induction signal transducer AmpG
MTFAYLLLLGFASGLPLLLIGSTLQAWYTVDGISISTIGTLSLVGLPYALKFLWAHYLDRYRLPLLGRRHGWLLLTQLVLMLCLLGMAFLTPKTHPELIALLAFITACFSASQDIVISAYIIEIIPARSHGFGAALYVTGYRLAMIISGGLALIVAQYVPWSLVYTAMAALMMACATATLFAKEPPAPLSTPATPAHYWAPFAQLWARENILWIGLFIVLYKLSDAMIQVMAPVFLLRTVGFSLAVVGAVTKGFGLATTLIGVFLGGMISARYPKHTALIALGLLQAVSNLLYYGLFLVGKSYILLVCAIGLENLFAGMVTAVITAFLMGLCDHRYTAAQFAVLSALAALGRVLIGPVAGWWITQVGWGSYYLLSCLVMLPACMLLYSLHQGGQVRAFDWLEDSKQRTEDRL